MHCLEHIIQTSMLLDKPYGQILMWNINGRTVGISMDELFKYQWTNLNLNIDGQTVGISMDELLEY